MCFTFPFIFLSFSIHFPFPFIFHADRLSCAGVHAHLVSPRPQHRPLQPQGGDQDGARPVGSQHAAVTRHSPYHGDPRGRRWRGRPRARRRARARGARGERGPAAAAARRGGAGGAGWARRPASRCCRSPRGGRRRRQPGGELDVDAGSHCHVGRGPPGPMAAVHLVDPKYEKPRSRGSVNRAGGPTSRPAWVRRSGGKGLRHRV
mmetsp:Transcript_30324/g.80310  ORF Transcript_30324/g.80310 Transcript_30324/m.80310 type:complete len:205 (-) Transcript_30324:463-1077(-)